MHPAVMWIQGKACPHLLPAKDHRRPVLSAHLPPCAASMTSLKMRHPATPPFSSPANPAPEKTSARRLFIAFTGAIENRDGAVRRAQGGTLFLDEICDMDISMQSKLLRFLQTLTYMRVGGKSEESSDIRIICATNRNPHDEVQQGRFRHDLYYRLHVVPIAMPALRGRGDDILDIADYTLHMAAAEEGKRFIGLTHEARDFLIHHDWPGNVRELQNMIRSLTVLYDGPLVTMDMLRPAGPRPGLVTTDGTTGAGHTVAPLWRVEKDAIEQAIRLCNGNIPRAAALLEIAPSTIYRKKLSWDARECE